MGTLHGTDEGPWAIIIGEKVIWGIQDVRASDLGAIQGRKDLEVAEIKECQAVPFY